MGPRHRRGPCCAALQQARCEQIGSPRQIVPPLDGIRVYSWTATSKNCAKTMRLGRSFDRALQFFPCRFSFGGTVMTFQKGLAYAGVLLPALLLPEVLQAEDKKTTTSAPVARPAPAPAP